MAADLGLVVDAAEAHAHELAAHGPGDALAERGLAHAWRSDEGEDRTAERLREASHREVLEDPVLDLLQAVMVLVEDLGGRFDIEVVGGGRVPGQGDEPVHVSPDDADLGRGRRDPAHAVDFLERPSLDFLGHAGRFDLLAKLVDLGLLGILLAELALNCLQLLAQDVFPLGLVHLGLDLGLDLALQLEDLDLPAQEIRDELEPLEDVARLEQLHALLGRKVRAVRDHVGQQSGLADVAGRDRGLRRNGRSAGDVLLDLRLHGSHQGLDFDAVRRDVGQLFDRDRDVGVRRGKADDPEAGLALDDRSDGPVLELDDLGNACQGPNRVQLGRVTDVLLLGGSLSHEGDGTVGCDGRIQGRDAFIAADLERDDHLGEDDRLAQGDQGQLAGSDYVDLLLLVPLGRSVSHLGSPRGVVTRVATIRVIGRAAG